MAVQRSLKRCMLGTLTVSIVKNSEAFASVILAIAAVFDLEGARAPPPAAILAAPGLPSSRTGRIGENGAIGACLLRAVDACLTESPLETAIVIFGGTTEAVFLATVEEILSVEEARLTFPEEFAAFELRETKPALEPVEGRALVLPSLAAFEPSGVDSTLEALRKERPIAAGATTLGAITIQTMS